MKTLLCIDPGASGGIAVRFHDGTIKIQKMPETQGDILDVIRDVRDTANLESGSEAVAILELVGGFCGKGQPGSAAFKFGEGFGFWKGAIQMACLRLELVRPQAWQKTFSLGTAASCASKTIWKNKLKSEAQRLFPGQPVTLKTADALLILEWYRRQNP